MRLFVVIGLIALFPGPSRAQTAGEALPDVVDSGLKALVSEGYSAALDTWATTWTDPTDVQARRQIEDGFKRLFQSYGPTRDYEVVEVMRVGRRVQRVHAVLAHDKLPVYLALVAYYAPDGWRVTSITFNIVAEEVFSRRPTSSIWR